MKHMRFCPIRTRKSKNIFYCVILQCLLLIIVLFLFKIRKIDYVKFFDVWEIKTCIPVSIMFFVIIIFYCGAIKNNYCRREIAFWAVLTKKRITMYGPMWFKGLKINSIQKVFVCNAWVYNKKEWEFRAPKGAKSRWAEFTGNNEKNFDFQTLFVIMPEKSDLSLITDATSEGKTKLTKENYAKYKQIANNKKIIMLDGTEKNYNFLRQVFEYEKFEGINKFDAKIINDFEQIFEDKIVRKI